MSHFLWAHLTAVTHCAEGAGGRKAKYLAWVLLFKTKPPVSLLVVRSLSSLFTRKIKNSRKGLSVRSKERRWPFLKKLSGHVYMEYYSSMLQREGHSFLLTALPIIFGKGFILCFVPQREPNSYIFALFTVFHILREKSKTLFGGSLKRTKVNFVQPFSPCLVAGTPPHSFNSFFQIAMRSKHAFLI